MPEQRNIKLKGAIASLMAGMLGGF